jgi:hypothetical protein
MRQCKLHFIIIILLSPIISLSSIMTLNQQRSNGHGVNVLADTRRPGGLQAVVEGELVHLSWDAPHDSEGLVGYIIYRDDEVISDSFITETSYVEGAPSGGFYNYKVAAFYSNGEINFGAVVECQVFLRAGGLGTAQDPFLIATAHQLIELVLHPDLMDQHFRLVSDIDLDPNLPGRKVFTGAVIGPDISPMRDGFQGHLFSGVFDGGGHTIRNLTIEGHSYLGLFGALGAAAQVIHVNVVNVDVTGNGWNIGALAGTNEGTVQACYSSGLVMGYSDVGGLVGVNGSAHIIDSSSDADVVGIESVGGLVGSQLSDYSDEAAVRGSNATGSVFGWQWVGGLVGFNQGTVSTCSSDSFINGASSVGGLVGYNAGTGFLTDAFCLGPVQGEDRVGGLAGFNAGRISFTYSSGEVTGVSHIGGLVGTSDTQAEVIASFWDREASGQSSSDGGVGLTTAELQKVNTYVNAGWDFAGESENGMENVWYLASDGYARFFAFEGAGTSRAPYLVDTVWHLTSIGSNPDMLDKHYKLTHHIDLDPNQLGSRVFTHAVIAPDMDLSSKSYEGVPFSGVFDGCGYEIRHMSIMGSYHLGLFGWIGSEAHVSNLSLVSAHVEVKEISPHPKGHALFATSQGLLAGTNQGEVQMCHTGGSMSGLGEQIGGLIGDNLGNVHHCTSSADVQGADTVGGLVGYHHEGQVTDCYSTGTVEPLESGAGGLIGENDAYVGRCYATGDVNSSFDAGGLVGENTGTVEQCYSTGSVAGKSRLGGLVGRNNGGEISECYSIGAVTGDQNVGGLVGWNDWIVTHSFWDTDTSGQSRSEGGFGMSTTQMHDINTFLYAGWDFLGREFFGHEDTWVMETYPVLYMSQLPGKGSSESPYLVSDKNKLIAFKNMLSSAHYRLTEDIDLTGNQWEGPLLDEYLGIFDGNGFSLRNVTLTGENYLGFFGILGPDATIKNLTLENVRVEGGRKEIGGLVGLNRGHIIHCDCTGVVTGNSYVGGLVGTNEGHVSHCFSAVAVTGGQVQGYIGGIVGSNSNGGHVLDCSSAATVTGRSRVGGIVGQNRGDVINCHSHATVSGSGSSVGGVVGRNTGAVTNCHSITTVSGDRSVGGLLGENSGTVNDSFSGGKVEGIYSTSGHLGGLVGTHKGLSVNRCYSTAQVSGDSRIGGLVGSHWEGRITTCYSTGSVNGNSRVGGLVGQSSGSITSCYSTGAVTGTEDGGGLVGLHYHGGSITTSFWDVQTSGRTHLCGIQDEGTTGCDDSFGLTTTEMQTLATFLAAGWNIKDDTAIGTNDIWYILDGQDYPALGWESRPRCASFPYPLHGTVYLSQPLVLTWQVGTWTAHHDVYFGDNEQRVALATTEDRDVYQGRLPVERNTFDPGVLRYNTSYYWRIDEVTDAQSDAPCRGPVWQFRTVDFMTSHSPANRAADVAWPALLSWVSSGPVPWYDVYFGEDEHAVAHATPESVGLYRGRQTADETAFTTGDLQPNKTYFWRIDGVDNAPAQNVWEGDVWQFSTTRSMIHHYPGNYATHTDRSVILSWTPNIPALGYDVYFGEDENAVAEATPESVDVYCGRQTSDETLFDPGNLESNTTYYWRIDVVDNADPQNIWKGDVWRFTTIRTRSR